MNNYSIEKIGSDYVVKVDDQHVMKVGSRRRAAQLVMDASGLLDDVSLVPHLTTSPAGEAGAVDGDAVDADAVDPHDVRCDSDFGPPSITRDHPEVA